MQSHSFNPELDLKIERIVDVSIEKIWKGWTDPKNIIKWFCPKPYEVYNCEVDLRPGGIFRTDMRGPNMPDTPCAGCILEVLENKKFVWTSALGPDFRPLPRPENGPDIVFTGIILLEKINEKETRYTAFAIHPDAETSRRHAEMGFEIGWGTCLDQLVAEIKNGNIN